MTDEMGFESQEMPSNNHFKMLELIGLTHCLFRKPLNQNEFALGCIVFS